MLSIKDLVFKERPVKKLVICKSIYHWQDSFYQYS